MAITKDSGPSYTKWLLILGYCIIFGIVLTVIFTDVFETSQPGQIPQIVWLGIGMVVLLALIIMIIKLIGISELLENTQSGMMRITEAQEKNRAALEELKENMRLSESAKAIVYREADTIAIRELVFNKLQDKNIDAANLIINELAATSQYKQLAEQLRKQTDSFLGAGDQGQQNQLIANIEQLFSKYEWAKASVQIENLIKAFPDSERAKQMRQELVDKKAERKKMLLNLWDDAVKREATDRSLEILRELDAYLTPNEGLALQEAARDVFRNKLHNIGVQFSIAVSGKQWEKALDAGERIIREFPNSKMAQEIREKLEVLKERVRESAA
jgi:hypothetical protein